MNINLWYNMPMLNITQLKSLITHSDSRIAAGVIDTDLRYSSMSRYEVELTGLKSQEAAIELTHYDLPCAMSKSAPELQRQYLKIIDTKKPLKVLNMHTTAQNNLGIYLTDKVPTLDSNNKVTEITYVCNELSETILEKLKYPLITTIEHFQSRKLPISLSYEIIERFEELDLTTRESECFYYLIRSRSAKSIAAALDISQRTVESHIENIKNKLNCYNKESLVDFAYALGLLHRIPLSLLPA
jgi:DNA-binding CsgD family transcriptional regulator